MTETTVVTPAAFAQRMRAAILTWPGVRAVHGPSLGRKNHFFFRVEMEDGTVYNLEQTLAVGQE